MAELFNLKIGGGQRLGAVAVISRLDQPFQRVEARSDDPISEGKLI